MMRLAVPGLFALILLSGRPLPAAVLLSGPVVETAAATNATVRWSTDVPTGGRVHFGLEPRQLTRRAEGSVTTNHSVTLTGLAPGTKYFFTVGTARYALQTNSFLTAAAADVEASAPARRKLSPDLKASDATAGTAVSRAPPSRATWGNTASLLDHFQRHGGDFDAKSPDDYARQAWEFLKRAKAENLPAKLDEDGVIRVFDPKTRAFAAYNRDGTTKTFFKPNSRDYFDRQPGRPVKLQDLKLK